MLQAATNPIVGAQAVFFEMPGPWEVVIIILAILLLFGGKKLPELARGLGRGLRTFRDELKGVSRDIEDDTKEPSPDEKPRQLREESDETGGPKDRKQ